MNFLRHSRITSVLAPAMEEGSFCVVDAGCAYGIHPVFRRLGGKLRALGIDANVTEIERLRSINVMPGITYTDALLTLPDDHPFSQEMGGVYWHYNYWERLMLNATLVAKRKKQQDESDEDKRDLNLVNELPCSERRVTLSDEMIAKGFTDVDVLKIDLDGPDFMVLQALDGRFDAFGITSVILEVGFQGTDAPTDNSFHNIDRFMRKNGFALFQLQTYSVGMRAFPSMYRSSGFTASTMSGRLGQGDALYVRDFCSSDIPVPPHLLIRRKLLNTVLLFCLCDLADCAAEILLAFRETFEPLVDVPAVLEFLVAQNAERGLLPGGVTSYAHLMRLLESDSPYLYTTYNRQG